MSKSAPGKDGSAKAAGPAPAAAGRPSRLAQAGRGTGLDGIQAAAGNRAAHGLLRGGGGRPLEPGPRAAFEARFGRGFGDVRVHTDDVLAGRARELGAKAFAVGNDIAFAPGRYAPGTPEGLHLLAHELAHVVQQGRGGPARPSLDGSGPLEDGARAAADAAVSAGAGPVSVAGSSGPAVACSPEDQSKSPARPGVEVEMNPSPEDMAGMVQRARGFDYGIPALKQAEAQRRYDADFKGSTFGEAKRSQADELADVQARLAATDPGFQAQGEEIARLKARAKTRKGLSPAERERLDRLLKQREVDKAVRAGLRKERGASERRDPERRKAFARGELGRSGPISPDNPDLPTPGGILGHPRSTYVVIKIEGLNPKTGKVEAVALAEGNFEGSDYDRKQPHAEAKALTKIRDQLKARGIDIKDLSKYRMTIVGDQTVCDQRCMPMLRKYGLVTRIESITSFYTTLVSPDGKSLGGAKRSAIIVSTPQADGAKQQMHEKKIYPPAPEGTGKADHDHDHGRRKQEKKPAASKESAAKPKAPAKATPGASKPRKSPAKPAGTPSKVEKSPGKSGPSKAPKAAKKANAGEDKAAPRARTSGGSAPGAKKLARPRAAAATSPPATAPPVSSDHGSAAPPPAPGPKSKPAARTRPAAKAPAQPAPAAPTTKAPWQAAPAKSPGIQAAPAKAQAAPAKAQSPPSKTLAAPPKAQADHAPSGTPHAPGASPRGRSIQNLSRPDGSVQVNVSELPLSAAPMFSVSVQVTLGLKLGAGASGEGSRGSASVHGSASRTLTWSNTYTFNEAEKNAYLAAVNGDKSSPRQEIVAANLWAAGNQDAARAMLRQLGGQELGTDQVLAVRDCASSSFSDASRADAGAAFKSRLASVGAHAYTEVVNGWSVAHRDGHIRVSRSFSISRGAGVEVGLQVWLVGIGYSADAATSQSASADFDLREDDPALRVKLDAITAASRLDALRDLALSRPELGGSYAVTQGTTSGDAFKAQVLGVGVEVGRSHSQSTTSRRDALGNETKSFDAGSGAHLALKAGDQTAYRIGDESRLHLDVTNNGHARGETVGQQSRTDVIGTTKNALSRPLASVQAAWKGDIGGVVKTQVDTAGSSVEDDNIGRLMARAADNSPEGRRRWSQDASYNDNGETTAAWNGLRARIQRAGNDREAVAALLQNFQDKGDDRSRKALERAMATDEGRRFEFPDAIKDRKAEFDDLVVASPLARADELAGDGKKAEAVADLTTRLGKLERLSADLAAHAGQITPVVFGEMNARIARQMVEIRNRIRSLSPSPAPAPRAPVAATTPAPLIGPPSKEQADDAERRETEAVRTETQVEVDGLIAQLRQLRTGEEAQFKEVEDLFRSGVVSVNLPLLGQVSGRLSNPSAAEILPRLGAIRQAYAAWKEATEKLRQLFIRRKEDPGQADRYLPNEARWGELDGRFKAYR